MEVDAPTTAVQQDNTEAAAAEPAAPAAPTPNPNPAATSVQQNADPSSAAAEAAAAGSTAAAASAGGTSAAANDACKGPTAAAAAAASGGGDGPQVKKQAKRKVAMHLAYLGAGYYGMQRNPDCRTIESELEGALTRAGAISEQNAGSFQKIHWNRAARTDKGVSALCQVVSAKLMIEPKETFADRVNTHLPQQVRVFGVQRATDGFDARKFCDKRKYEYVLPAWAFDPLAAAAGRTQQQQQQKAAAAKRAAKKGDSSARLADEAAALQAIAAAVLAAPLPEQQQQQQQQEAEGAAAVEDTPTAAAAAAEPDGEVSPPAAAAAAAGGGGGGADDVGGTSSQGDTAKPSTKSSSSSSSGQGKPKEAAEDELASTSKVGTDVLHRLRQDITVSKQRFVFGPAQLQRLNSLLAQYEGTHNYHNFTVRVLASDPAARRYILSFSAEAITIQGQPWVRLVVVGQSFMLHQIRKMVGMVLAIMRGVAPEECLGLALDPDRDINTPMAPELGLFLDETFYDAYNARFGELHGPISFDPYRQAATDFKYNVLYNHIAALDEKELVNALWLRGCTDAYYRFSQWPSQPKARQDSMVPRPLQLQGQQQQQQQANGQEHKRKQGDGSPGSKLAAAQQQPAAKQQRLERPGKLVGATAAMVVGMQETYGMRPHSDTPQAAEARRELKEMRDEFNRAQRDQQQQQQQGVGVQQVAEEELDALYG